MELRKVNYNYINLGIWGWNFELFLLHFSDFSGRNGMFAPTQKPIFPHSARSELNVDWSVRVNTVNRFLLSSANY